MKMFLKWFRFLLNVYSKMPKDRQTLKDRVLNQNTTWVLSLIVQKMRKVWSVSCPMLRLLVSVGQWLFRNDLTHFSGMLTIATHIIPQAARALQLFQRKRPEPFFPALLNLIIAQLTELVQSFCIASGIAPRSSGSGGGSFFQLLGVNADASCQKLSADPLVSHRTHPGGHLGIYLAFRLIDEQTKMNFYFKMAVGT